MTDWQHSSFVIMVASNPLQWFVRRIHFIEYSKGQWWLPRDFLINLFYIKTCKKRKTHGWKDFPVQVLDTWILRYSGIKYLNTLARGSCITIIIIMDWLLPSCKCDDWFLNVRYHVPNTLSGGKKKGYAKANNKHLVIPIIKVCI